MAMMKRMFSISLVAAMLVWSIAASASAQSSTDTTRGTRQEGTKDTPRDMTVTPGTRDTTRDAVPDTNVTPGARDTTRDARPDTNVTPGAREVTPTPKAREGALPAPRDGRTADDQPENEKDRNTTQLIRRDLTSDGALSTMAHNVTIVTVNGKVTLKGNVKSEAEKRIVEERAAKVAGKDNVTSELKVSP